MSIAALSACSSGATQNLPTHASPSTSPAATIPAGASTLPTAVVAPSIGRGAPHPYDGDLGGPLSGLKFDSTTPCPGNSTDGLVLMVGHFVITDVFICQVTVAGVDPSRFTGPFHRVPPNRIDALLKSLEYRPSSPQSQSCAINPPQSDVPLVVAHTANGRYYNIALRGGECPGTVPDDVARAIATALAPVKAYAAPGVSGDRTGHLDLSKACDHSYLVLTRTATASPQVPPLTTVYVCPPPAPLTKSSIRYYKTVPDTGTAALLSALAGPDFLIRGPWGHCTLITKDTGYALVGQAADGSMWRLYVPGSGCGQPTIAAGKALDAATGMHVYDKVKGYGL
jgi:hypothetical protein